MKKFTIIISVFTYLILELSCQAQSHKEKMQSDSVSTSIGKVVLPAPYHTSSNRKISKVIGWPENKTPIAPEGFMVTKYADNLEEARWMYILPNGDVLVAQGNKHSKVNQISLLRDADKNGVPEIKKVFIKGANMPFGMLLLKNKLYVAVTDGIYQYDYQTGDTELKGEGKKILELPAGGYNNHWTRNLISNKDGSKIMVSVGSGSNVGENGMEHEVRRANILEINPDGSGERVFAAGLRNPVGMDYNPVTNELWTAVNERDKLGDDLVPDYITSVKEGGFYGWPYSYFGKNVDPGFDKEKQRPDLVKTAIVPDVPLGAHTASLGLLFYTKNSFPQKYKNGAFVGQHGSWNRKEFSGYKVLFVPFENGKPKGKPEDFLTGFIADKEKSEVYGRPVGIVQMEDGSLLVSDDAAGTIWRVSAK